MIQGIIEIVVADAPLVSLVGMNVAGTKPKIYWIRAGDKEATPYIILALAGSQPNQVKDITSTLDTDTFNAFIYADSPEETDAIEMAFRTAIEGRKITTTTVYFHRIWKIGGNDGFDKDALRPFRVSQYNTQTAR